MHLIEITVFLSMGLGSLYTAEEKARLRSNIDDDEFSFVVTLADDVTVLRNSKFDFIKYCTGTQISEEWVIITAANCFMVIDASKVIYGDINVPSKTGTSDILTHHNHPGFRLATLSNDISLIKVKKVELKKLCKLSAVDYMSIAGLTVQFVGVPPTFKFKKTVSRKLNEFEQHQLNKRQIEEGMVVKCKRSHKDQSGPFICVSRKCKNKDQSMYGASGGPLMLNGKLVGITSIISYDEKTLTNRNFIFTPVSPYLEWIYDVMKR